MGEATLSMYLPVFSRTVMLPISMHKRWQDKAAQWAGVCAWGNSTFVLDNYLLGRNDTLSVCCSKSMPEYLPNSMANSGISTADRWNVTTMHIMKSVEWHTKCERLWVTSHPILSICVIIGMCVRVLEKGYNSVLFGASRKTPLWPRQYRTILRGAIVLHYFAVEENEWSLLENWGQSH